ncbi:hypothetical protein PBT90_13385 [Algoriphagus halophytocola]|uniref:DUF3299 domain-containing protein n=1 Tax=Algoriphagus halophytocola TaxID=2991499 RepID=A0ABY6ML40_9BACT|nr:MULTISPECIES: hypothetical protein [unclassified Algoriphagus]UZD24378.1 hypothetical protein OM944_07715 [Algoriphagus sp. TR-M5]WBL41746.1 hypothetical protein PBT90_13385 [Algoriphagus sp. TR-M9]
MKLLKKGILLCGMMILVNFALFAQDQNVWKNLSEVTYTISEDEYGELYVPVFSENITKMEGKVVEADGYIIPFDGMFKPDHIILSSLPLAECFFCGSGGPETVMEVDMASPIKYTSKRVRVRGTLTLNKKDPDKLMYILTNGTLVE